MIRAVLDTNIYVGALIRPTGLAARIFQAAIEGQFEFVTSPQIRQEIGEVLFYPEVRLKHKKSAEVTQRFLQRIEQVSIKVLGDLGLKVVADDPEDDKFIIAAVQGEAQYIVSRDSHLLELKSYQNI